LFTFKKESPMFNLKRTVLFTAAVATLTLAPITPASAVVPWFFAHHVVEAIVGFAALSSAAATPAPYPAAPAYAAPNYYAPPAYYARPPAPYYSGPGYSRPAVSYARPVQHFYAAPRGYYAPSSRYTGLYGAHYPYQSGRNAYRRR
jgi:hypothetical protein